MNKKLLTLAVAAAMAVPAIASAEAILYGKVNVSLDYIDVEQNATFFRPGQQVGPKFTMGTFVNGSTAGYDVEGALGSYDDRISAFFNNPLNFNPWVAGVVDPGPNMPFFGPGGETWNNLDQAEKSQYYEAALAALGASGSQLVAQEAGAASMADFNPWQAANEAYVASVDAYEAALTAGKTVDQAIEIAANVYNDQAAESNAIYQANVEAAEDDAFSTVGPKAGYKGMSRYLAGQQERLDSDLAIGNISQDFYNNQTTRLEGLQRLAYSAAAMGAFKAGTAYKGWGMDQSWFGPASRVGVKGSEDLGNGLKAVYQIELGVDMTNAYRDANITNGNRADGFAFRNTFVGLAGDWGTFLLGRHDTPLKISTGKLDLFSDTLADYNNTIGYQDLRADSAVAYISPSWSGFQFMAAIVPQGGATALGVFNPDEDSIAGAYSLAAIYKNGPFYGSVAYESLEAENFAADDANYELLYGEGMTAESDNKWRVGLGLLDWNGFSLTAIYEDREHIYGAPEDADGNFFQVQAGYAFGNNMIKAMWGRADLNRCADPNNVGFRYTCPSSALGEYFAENILVQNSEKSSWAVGYDYNFSKRTTAFALYTQVTDNIEDADWSGFSIGMLHRF